jgi:hypothetical protein
VGGGERERLEALRGRQGKEERRKEERERERGGKERMGT